MQIRQPIGIRFSIARLVVISKSSRSSSLHNLGGMPPKPQIFKTPDGKEFTKKSEWRDYMVSTFYSFKDKKNETEPLIKTPGSVEGQMFTIENCENCTMALCDHSEQVHVDNVKNCRVLIGACASSIFIRNCEDCIFYCCSQQLRLRDCVRCKFYVFSIAEVHIELSNKVEFGPFQGGYPEHGNHLKAARLDTTHNLWYDIYDHNDSEKTKENWALIDPAKYEAPWFPMGECDPALLPTHPGEVDRSKDVDPNMVSFGKDQLVVDSTSNVASPDSHAAATMNLAPIPSIADPDPSTIDLPPPAPPADDSSGTTAILPTSPKNDSTTPPGESTSSCNPAVASETVEITPPPVEEIEATSIITPKE